MCSGVVGNSRPPWVIRRPGSDPGCRCAHARLGSSDATTVVISGADNGHYGGWCLNFFTAFFFTAFGGPRELRVHLRDRAVSERARVDDCRDRGRAGGGVVRRHARRGPDVGIWLSRRSKAGWTAPVEVANGVQPDGTRHPCWNPVLFDVPRQGLTLFYKVGPEPADVVGHGSHVARQRPNVERRAAAARRHPRSDQEQADRAVRRDDRRRQQHRDARDAEQMARALRALDRCRARPGRRFFLHRRDARDRRDPAVHPRASRRHGYRPSAARARAASSRRGRVDGGNAWTPHRPHDAAESKRRHRRRDARATAVT